MFTRLRSFLGVLRGRERFEAQMAEELQFHIDSRVADLESKGLTRAQARAQARREFGNPVAFEDRCRDARRLAPQPPIRCSTPAPPWCCSRSSAPR